MSGTRHHAFMATAPTGEMVMAIAHIEPDGTAVIDAVRELIVEGGEAGIDAFYRGMRARGIEVNDFRQQAGPRRPHRGNVKATAIAGALRMARAN